MQQRIRMAGAGDRLSAALLLLVALGVTMSCSSIRASVRDLRNEDMVGEMAPPLAGEVWVRAGTEVHREDRAQPGWRLLAFFIPW